MTILHWNVFILPFLFSLNNDLYLKKRGFSRLKTFELPVDSRKRRRHTTRAQRWDVSEHAGEVYEFQNEGIFSLHIIDRSLSARKFAYRRVREIGHSSRIGTRSIRHCWHLEKRTVNLRSERRFKSMRWLSSIVFQFF